MLDAFELQEQLIRVLVLTAAELTTIVGEHRLDGGALLLEGWQHVVVEQLDGGQRQLVGIQLRPGIAAEAVDRGLQIDGAQISDEGALPA